MLFLFLFIDDVLHHNAYENQLLDVSILIKINFN